MLRTEILLYDGRTFFSGAEKTIAVKEATLTQCVNSETELTLGSVCSSMLECTLIAPHAGVHIANGMELVLYKVDDSNARHQIGFFTIESSTQLSPNTYKFVAYDRITRLDKDMTDWLMSLEGWPYTVNNFAQMVCAECDLVLETTSLLNGDYPIQRFIGEGITGRKLMEWIGQICAKFCRMTPNGTVEFAWYRQISKSIGSAGDYRSFGNSLSYEDYMIRPIEKIQIQLTTDDLGVVFPSEAGEKNTYKITGNYLLTADAPAALAQVAENIFAAVRYFTYTPGKVSIPANLDINAGDMIQVRDANGFSFPFCVMNKVQKAQKDTLEGTGFYRRDASTVVHEESFRSVNAKMLEIRKDIDGLFVRSSSLSTQIEDSKAYADEQLAEFRVQADSMLAEVSRQTEDIDGVRKDLASIRADADSVSISVSNIMSNGISKVATTNNYTFDENGLHIHKEGGALSNELTENGMYVTRDVGTNNATVMLKADADGVEATDLKARNYLIIGDYSRFEDFEDEDGTLCTACFWIGG